MANDDFALVPLFCALPEAKKSFASLRSRYLCCVISQKNDPKVRPARTKKKRRRRGMGRSSEKKTGDKKSGGFSCEARSLSLSLSLSVN